MKIERVLFWFRDGQEKLINLNNDFFGLSVLCTRLLNKNYSGKKIGFINIDFMTDNTYDYYPILKRESVEILDKDLRYFGTFDNADFNTLDKVDKQLYIWDKGHKYLFEMAVVSNNIELQQAVEYSYQEGLNLKLIPDYETIYTEFHYNSKPYKASIWICFADDYMYSKLIVENSGRKIFEKEIARTNLGVEFFLVIYKKITVENDCLIIRGPKDVDHLPFRIALKDIIF
ncbi:hypothetical protein ACFOWU_09720 [Epilithonimonas zeae]|uniref:Uncharacterized protein n=1 Tax=Epilithonimonas zeae TaxID=1416779 RepID=A0A1N6GSU0_9FLAO|nr:hypothetical protein [Epilithonimonas zeae]SIO10562.1 hypothetical protein SAMN05444409_2028 [Epilithonimonas zeae]